MKNEQTFSEYYQFYLSLHQDKWCRRLHVMGQLATISFIVYAVITNLWLLLLAPFVVYPFAWTGHKVFEKNRPLAWEGINDYGLTTLKAKVCDALMFRDWILGRVER